MLIMVEYDYHKHYHYCVKYYTCSFFLFDSAGDCCFQILDDFSSVQFASVFENNLPTDADLSNELHFAITNRVFYSIYIYIYIEMLIPVICTLSTCVCYILLRSFLCHLLSLSFFYKK